MVSCGISVTEGVFEGIIGGVSVFITVEVISCCGVEFEHAVRIMLHKINRSYFRILSPSG